MQPAGDCGTSATETQRLETKFAAAPFQGYEDYVQKADKPKAWCPGGGKGAFKRPRFVAPRPLNAAVPAKTNKASVEESALDSTTQTQGGNVSDIESKSLKNVTNTDSSSLHGRTFGSQLQGQPTR